MSTLEIAGKGTASPPSRPGEIRYRRRGVRGPLPAPRAAAPTALSSGRERQQAVLPLRVGWCRGWNDAWQTWGFLKWHVVPPQTAGLTPGLTGPQEGICEEGIRHPAGGEFCSSFTKGSGWGSYSTPALRTRSASSCVTFQTRVTMSCVDLMRREEAALAGLRVVTVRLLSPSVYEDMILAMSRVCGESVPTRTGGVLGGSVTVPRVWGWGDPGACPAGAPVKWQSSRLTGSRGRPRAPPRYV